MTAPQQPPPPPRPSKKKLNTGILLIIVGAVVVLCGGGCGSLLLLGSSTTTTTQVAAPTTAAPVTTEAPTTAGPPLTATPAAGCVPAAADDIAPITANLVPPAASIGEAYVATSGELTYLGANIYDVDGGKVSSADVWVKRGGVWYALSGGARDSATALLGDGRDLPEAPSAGDDTGLRVQACATS